MKENCVIPFANAGPKPNTVMVKTHHAIIAIVAVRSAEWSEYLAGLTEFQFVNMGISSNCAVLLCL